MFIRHFLDTWILCFCDIQKCFHRYSHRGAFLCNNDFFFKNVQLFYAIFKSYRSILKSPEFIALDVSKHASSTPALKPPSWLLNHSLHNFNETTSSHQIHILYPSLLPKFSALALHCSHLKSSIYTCCKFFHIKVMIKVLSVSNYHTV